MVLTVYNLTIKCRSMWPPEKFFSSVTTTITGLLILRYSVDNSPDAQGRFSVYSGPNAIPKSNGQELTCLYIYT